MQVRSPSALGLGAVLFLWLLPAAGAATNSVVSLHPEPRFSDIARLIAGALPEMHLMHKPVDDALSRKAWTLFLSSLDPEHLFFLASDIAAFKEYELRMDDDLASGKVDFAFTVFERFKQRVRERYAFTQDLLKTPLDLGREETYRWDRKDAPWPANAEEQDAAWNRKIRNEYLQHLVAAEMAPPKTDKPKDNAAASPSPEKQKPEEKVLKRYKRFSEVLDKLTADQVFERYLNAFTRACDPHCEYMSPVTAAEFDVDMKLSFGGIGAVLGDEDGVCKVSRIVPDSPAGRDTRDIRLKPGDKIIAVGQGDQPPEDIANLTLNQIISKIRGKVGTRVVLTVIPASDTVGAATKTVDLVRDEIKLEDRSARLKTRELKTGNGPARTIGLIALSAFYGDIQGKIQGKPDAKSSTRDVAKLLAQVRRQKMDGLILDLRHNGGGSLPEAVSLTGLFIETGPIVLVKEGRTVKILPDANPAVSYAGPLVVLIDRQTASAAEILAGALQDYGRAIVVGDSKTHGKGTVQTVIPVGKDNKNGTLKVTNALFFRVTGSSTQLKGVSPDILMPSPLDVTRTGEDLLPHALEYSMIQPVRFRPFADLLDVIRTLSDKSDQRRAADPHYAAYTNYLASIQAMSRVEEVPLSLSNRLAMAREQKKVADRQEEFIKPPEDEKKDDGRDIVLAEALSVMGDLIPLYPREMEQRYADAPPAAEDFPALEDALTPAQREEIQALIDQLGDPTPRVRKEAFGKLKAMKQNAFPLLKKNETHSDPEIQQAVKELLKP